MSANALDEFRLEPDVYRVGQFSPVSIRDQIVRANFLVEHLVGQGQLAPATSRLVVVGAGCAGVSLVDAAMRHGIADVTLVERSSGVMSLQSPNSSRWLDPVQYDWPASYWQDTEWPIKETPPRRTNVVARFSSFKADSAQAWSILFRNRLNKLLVAAGGALKTQFGVEAGVWFRAGGALQIPLTGVVAGAPAVSPLSADVLILAAGFGVEDCTLRTFSKTSRAPIADFEGLSFWDLDQFQTVQMGLSGPSRDVLVSGSGDGGLQDFVRLTTGLDSVAEIMAVPWNAVGSAGWKEKLQGLWHWEEHASRGRKFAPFPADQCDLLRLLEDQHERALADLWASPQGALLDRFLWQYLSVRAPGAVRLATRCDHFSWCYGLNRSVALLVVECLRRHGYSDVVMRGVSPLATMHVSSPRGCLPGCWGHLHEVALASGVTCATSQDDLDHWKGSVTIERYMGLVIRHGIDPLKYGVKTLARMSPQPVPFHLP